jgi:hypothetical protein
VDEVVFPQDNERILRGNVAFTEAYLRRVLAQRPRDCGVALLHSHLGPGWQDMSEDDVVAERDRLAGPVWGQTAQPLLGMTWATDGFWSARFWVRVAPKVFERRDVQTVRVVGRRLTVSRHPRWHPDHQELASQEATISAWGTETQRALAALHVGVVGLGSVGSLVSEGLARIGVASVSLIDFDQIQERNLDRTLGATRDDVRVRAAKVHIAERSYRIAATASAPTIKVFSNSVAEPVGWRAAADCDVLISCVDMPLPRFILNVTAYSHLIPVVDGGIAARVLPDGTPLHIDWRIHTVGPGNACLLCLRALDIGDVGLELDGLLDDPDYVKGLSDEQRARFDRRNVFAFSMSVAAHQLLQLVGLVTESERVGGVGPQFYHCYPGKMDVIERRCCDSDCYIADYRTKAVNLSGHFRGASNRK